MKLIIFVALMSASFCALAVDLNEVEKELTSTGVVGWIHASVQQQNLYVFTYRNPNDFFDYVEMSLTTDKPTIKSELAQLNRHDKVRVKGSFLDNPSPQKHIDIDSIELVQKYNSGYEAQPYEYEAKIPEDLVNESSAQFLVHAVAGEGHILVVEYKDAVLPVYVKNANFTKNLYRNDVVELNFKIQHRPKEPVHLNLIETNPQAVQVIDSIHAKHGKSAEGVEGALILFPKSPEINRNVFAVSEDLPSGLHRQYTLVGTSPDLLKQIFANLQNRWDAYPGGWVNGRNKLVSMRLRVRVKAGTYNEIDPSQANAQIFLTSPEDLEIIER